MSNDGRPSWTGRDEENLLLEISEDRRLRTLGIDPDSDSLEILLQLKEPLAAIRSIDMCSGESMCGGRLTGKQNTRAFV